MIWYHGRRTTVCARGLTGTVRPTRGGAPKRHGCGCQAARSGVTNGGGQTNRRSKPEGQCVPYVKKQIFHTLSSLSSAVEMTSEVYSTDIESVSQWVYQLELVVDNTAFGRTDANAEWIAWILRGRGDSLPWAGGQPGGDSSQP